MQRGFGVLRTYLECPWSTSGPCCWWKALWMTGDAMTQQGAGAAGCVRDRTPASAPGLAVIPAFLNSCRIPRLVVRKLFRQCIVKGQKYSGRWGVQVFFLCPPPNTRSCSVDVQWPGPCGLQTSNSWCRLTAWIKYRLWLCWGGSRGEGGGALTQAVLPQTDQQTTLSVISPVIYQWVLQTRVLLTDTLWWVQKFSFISEP